MRLIPRIKIEKYPINSIKAKDDDKHRSKYGWSPVVGVTLTRKEGWGIGFGLGLLDFWFGWPREQERLCRKGCVDGNHVWVDQAVYN